MKILKRQFVPFPPAFFEPAYWHWYKQWQRLLISKSKPEALKIVSIYFPPIPRHGLERRSYLSLHRYCKRSRNGLVEEFNNHKMASTDSTIGKEPSTSFFIAEANCCCTVSSALVVKRINWNPSDFQLLYRHKAGGYRHLWSRVSCLRDLNLATMADVFVNQSNSCGFSTKVYRLDNFSKRETLLLTPTNSGVMIS